MKKIISLVLITLTLSGCFLRVHKMDITQGNIIKAEETAKLHPGMSESQVRAVMGNPLLMNIFDDNRMIYVYTYQPPYKTMMEKRVICTFSHGILQKITYE